MYYHCTITARGGGLPLRQRVGPGRASYPASAVGYPKKQPTLFVVACVRTRLRTFLILLQKAPRSNSKECIP